MFKDNFKVNRITFLAFVILLVSTFFEGNIMAQEKTCEDSELIYKNCTSQNLVFEQALAKSKKQKKKLLIKYGFEECPWCKNLFNLFTKGDLKSFVETEFVLVNINIKTPTGKDIFKKYKGTLKEEATKVGYPFLVVLNSQNFKQIHLDTGELEDNSKDKAHDIGKVKAALKEALQKIL